MSVEIIYDTNAVPRRGRTGEVCLSNGDFGCPYCPIALRRLLGLGSQHPSSNR